MLAAGGQQVFEVEIPDDAEIEGDVAVATFLYDIGPNVPGALLIEIADTYGTRREARWGYFLHLIDGEVVVDDHIPDFIADEIEDGLEV